MRRVAHCADAPGDTVAELSHFADVFVGTDCTRTNGFVFWRQLDQVEVHAKVRAHRNAAGKVHRTIARMCDVTDDGHQREEIGIVPLHRHAYNWIDIVTGPELVEMTQCAVVHPPAAAGTQHQLRL